MADKTDRHRAVGELYRQYRVRMYRTALAVLKSPALAEEELAFLGVQQSGELGYYVLCVVREPVQETTVNLKCPVVINPDTRTAIQAILTDGGYHMRHRLAEFRSGEAVAPC